MIKKDFNIYGIMSLSKDTLSYLIDDGYIFDTKGFSNNGSIIMEFKYKNHTFNWKNIKYDFIPFLLSLDQISNIKDIKLRSNIHSFSLYINDFKGDNDILNIVNIEDCDIYYIEIILGR